MAIENPNMLNLVACKLGHWFFFLAKLILAIMKISSIHLQFLTFCKKMLYWYMVPHCKRWKFHEKNYVTKKLSNEVGMKRNFLKKKLLKKCNNFWFKLFQIEISMDSEPRENLESEKSLTLSYFNQLQELLKDL